MKGGGGAGMAAMAAAEYMKPDIKDLKDPTNDYQVKLQNIDRTINTTNNFANILASPKTIIGLLILVGGVLLILTLFKSQIAKLFGALFAPFKETINENKANNKAREATGEDPTISDDEAKSLCYELGACINKNGDNEEGVVKVVKKIKTAADWHKANYMFSACNIYCKKWMQRKHTHETIEEIINCNMNKSNDRQYREQMISHLRSIGVPNETIHIQG